jgi:hypothetical protein
MTARLWPRVLSAYLPTQVGICKCIHIYRVCITCTAAVPVSADEPTTALPRVSDTDDETESTSDSASLRRGIFSVSMVGPTVQRRRRTTVRVNYNIAASLERIGWIDDGALQQHMYDRRLATCGPTVGCSRYWAHRCSVRTNKTIGGQ